MRLIKDVVKEIKAEQGAIYLGDYIAKLALQHGKKDPRGKLILVSAISPTPTGEGKTTTAIALSQGLKKINKKVIVALREPSLGPVFGVKGGATGGGKAIIEPLIDINLHFSGDLHALTTINNLIAATIDNHIFHGNSLRLDINKIFWKRALDLNDRALRKITIDSGKYQRSESFIITVASEVMAIFSLATDLDDFKNRLGKAIIGKSLDDKFVFVKDLKITDALAALCIQAIKPNLVQTGEGVPAIVHGGPFANIAHGCNSLIATKMALGLADYVVTEAGFGFDLGGEKFLDIKCRIGNLQPSLIVLVTTVKGLKYHGIGLSEAEKLSSGLISNLGQHIKAISNYNLPLVVTCNRFADDQDEEIATIREFCQQHNVLFELNNGFLAGGEGTIDLANLVVSVLKEKSGNFKLLYDVNDSIPDKIKTIATKIYGASDVIFSDVAKTKIADLVANQLDALPICIAKTPLSFTDDQKIVYIDKPFSIHITDISISAGAGFIVALAGAIMLMPGLPAVPAAERVVVENEIIKGIK